MNPNTNIQNTPGGEVSDNPGIQPPEVPLVVMPEQQLIRPSTVSQPELPPVDTFFQPVSGAYNPYGGQPPMDTRPQYGPGFMQPQAPQQYAQLPYEPEIPQKKGKLKKIAILAGAMFGVVAIAILVTTLMAAKNKDFAPNKADANTVELTNYTSQTGKFSMLVPKGWTITDKKSETDDNTLNIAVNNPADPNESSDKASRTMYITYTHEVDSNAGSTYDEYLENIKADVAQTVSSASDFNETVVQDSAAEIIISGKKAYRVQLTTTDGKTSTASTSTKLYVYVDELTSYILEFSAATNDSEFNAKVNEMLVSFKPQ